MQRIIAHIRPCQAFWQQTNCAERQGGFIADANPGVTASIEVSDNVGS